MRLRYSSVLAFAFPAAVAVVLACTSGTYDNQCAGLGGACVTNEDQCGGSLPFACTVGMCCVPNGVPDASADDASTITPVDSSTVDKTPDANAPDATLGTDAEPASPDAGVTTDSASPTSDATAEAEVPDQTAPVDAGQDVSLDAATHDASTADAATHDSSTHDAAVMDAGAGDTGSSLDGAAPTCLGYAAPATIALCTGCNPSAETCQNNGCYGGYYCDLAKLSCVKPSKVVCDAGL